MHWAACCPPTGAQATGESSSRVLCWCSCTLAGRAGTGMGQDVRRWMVLMNPRMLPMPVACVTARATVSLDVCGCVVVHAVIGIHMHHAVHSRVPVQVRCMRGAHDAVRSAARAAAKPLAGECPPARRFRTNSGRSPCTERFYFLPARSLLESCSGDRLTCPTPCAMLDLVLKGGATLLLHILYVYTVGTTDTRACSASD